ncbi:MAG: hypothetical protein M1840_003986 [Geoglossum simile]|nr:MAG: hypothetical protein M1840_003986 [Geoglossum simile]
MAKLTSSSTKSSSSNQYQMGADSRPNILASCYVVDAGLKGFHYSSTGAGGGSQFPKQPSITGPSGIPEVGSGNSSPPRSPPLIAGRYNKTSSTDVSLNKRQPRGGAAHTITEECERLFCESMKIVFLGERGSTDSGALVTGAHISNNGRPGGEANTGLLKNHGNVHKWLEVWDYVGGGRFRGFVSEGEARSLFIFFDEGVIGRDLKHGLIALLELAGSTHVQCSQLVVCIDRTTDTMEMKSLMRDLGWVGFELTTLSVWAAGADHISKRWLFLGMEV